jgi:ADP-L-glycero-D-manno-heptose 6-epimerase
LVEDQLIVVTGAAGFIGSNIVRGLNARGARRVLAVDDLTDGDKFRNLVDCDLCDYLDREEFLARLEAGDLDDEIGAILHQGACSDTMERDGRYMLHNNYRYSVSLLEHCQDNDVPFLYASSAAVYGGGQVFREERRYESPLNVYGYSKLLFDEYVRRALPDRTAPIVGFRYFNVYGPRERHKGRMASVAMHFFDEYLRDGRVRLFHGSGGYGDGEQRRDFIHVDDVVAANLWFLERSELSGIYNLGTGRAATFNTMAHAVIDAIESRRGGPRRDLPALVAAGAIEYVPMPAALEGRYQSYTEADVTSLRRTGYDATFVDVVEGADRYVERLMARD